MRRLLLALVVAGGVLGFYGYQEMRLAEAAKPEAQVLTCDQLATRGPGENAHVRLTDFELLDNYIYREGKNGKWATSYVPAVAPRVKDVPTVQNVNVLIKSNRARDEAALYKLADGPIEGVVINLVAGLGADEKRLLSESYPTLNFDKCWILEAGKTPASHGQVVGMLGGGAGLAVIGLGILLVGGKKSHES